MLTRGIATRFINFICTTIQAVIVNNELETYNTSELHYVQVEGATVLRN